MKLNLHYILIKIFKNIYSELIYIKVEIKLFIILIKIIYQRIIIILLIDEKEI